MSPFDYKFWMSKEVSCAHYVEYIDVKTGKKVRAKRTCKHKLCWFCSRKKSYKRTQDTIKRLGGKSAFKLVITMPKYDIPIRSQMAMLRKRLNKLLRRQPCKKQVQGGICSFEFTYTQRFNKLHAHVHVLIEAEDLDIRRLQEVHKEIEPNSPKLYIEPLEHDPQVRRERIGYYLKPHQTAIKDSAHTLKLFLDGTKRARLTGRFGSWFGTDPED